MITWSMRSGVMPARSMAARAATAPSSIADRLASAPPGCPSPRLPPIHSAMGVRAPETITMSGVDVATTMRSIAAASSPAASRARRAASTARSLEPTSGSAKWRARMPVRSTIHWSEVSTPWAASCAASWSLVSRLGGRKLPVPVMREWRADMDLRR